MRSRCVGVGVVGLDIDFDAVPPCLALGTCRLGLLLGHERVGRVDQHPHGPQNPKPLELES